MLKNEDKKVLDDIALSKVSGGTEPPQTVKNEDGGNSNIKDKSGGNGSNSNGSSVVNHKINGLRN
ncbi:hypothetical protein [Butyrivibrio sp. AE2032]|uniref:hypothetical protein n=1 Tax=Butyrivibrio sp. AE2032 TaxID=1458463 RepID=UPI00055156B4|nr:hypothetical protein [Butyrivibrio sp. AE2032]